MRFDLLIKGGEVVDPGGGHSGRLDVAIKRNRIAAVEANIPDETAFRVVDAGGHYVTPGLVDLHTHVNYGCGFYGVRPDPIAARSGVTTWLDVGSSGGYNFPGFRQFIIEEARARIYALLNISSIGLTAQDVGTGQPRLLRCRPLLPDRRPEPRRSAGRQGPYRQPHHQRPGPRPPAQSPRSRRPL